MQTPATENKNKVHCTVHGELLSDYELFVTFLPGNKIKSRTYRGDNTVTEYARYGTVFTDQPKALLYKLNNIMGRVASAFIYDNTGNVKRAERLVYRNGQFEKQTL